MFQIIKSSIQIRDRFVINLIPLSENLRFYDCGYSRFIVGFGSFISEDFDIKNSLFTVTTTKEFNLNDITGGMVIEMPGFCFAEQYMAILNASLVGNLSYIDGCSNSNIISPPRNGDPCLNYLYFPKNINQTFHTHPSLRIGFITSGRGIAETTDEKFNLEKGDVFILDRYARHRFKTNNSHMSLVAFHPDSEDGPRDEHNPMKSRTHI